MLPRLWAESIEAALNTFVNPSTPTALGFLLDEGESWCALWVQHGPNPMATITLALDTLADPQVRCDKWAIAAHLRPVASMLVHRLDDSLTELCIAYSTDYPDPTISASVWLAHVYRRYTPDVAPVIQLEPLTLPPPDVAPAYLDAMLTESALVLARQSWRG